MKFKPFTSELPNQAFTSQISQSPFIEYGDEQKASPPLEIPYGSRFRHVYIAGASQHGKSTIMEHMIAQDMQNNEGVTVLDPKGDLAESILYRVPAHRIDDCIYIDIKDPVPIDFMSWKTEEELQTLLANLNETFLRFSTMTSGDQWLAILRWTIYTLLVARHTSFLDIYYFLARLDRHTEIFDRVKSKNTDGRYDDILHYWEEEFPKLKAPREGPILTRMSPFTTSGPLKKILGTPDPKLNIFDCMENRKILIVKLMGVGRQNGNLVGTLLTSKILQAAFTRQGQDRRGKRVPHFFYADEFQNFQTPDFEDILAEAGGFKLSLTLANQGLYQLENKIRQAIFTNVTAARIAFRLNHDDVHNWKQFLSTDKDDPNYIPPERLATLRPYTAFFAIDGQTPVIEKTSAPMPDPTPEQVTNAENIKKSTIERYGGTTAERVLNSGRYVSVDPAADNELHPTNLLPNPSKKSGPRKSR